MAGIDYKSATIDIREKISFTETEIIDICGKIYAEIGVFGCIILSTCNRTEIYISCSDGFDISAEQLLLKYSKIKCSQLKFKNLENMDAVYHLIEVACGIHSKILGESQIFGQINNACEISRNNGFSDSVLNTLFRIAVTAGKYAVTNVKIVGVPVSSSYSAVKLLAEKLGTLRGKRGLVIGNGKMGKIACRLLLEQKCKVSVTVRTYKHSLENKFDYKNCDTVDYRNRFLVAEDADFIISATKSPHFTVTEEDVLKLKNPPKVIVDLSLPRDIDPNIYNLSQIECFNVDDLTIDYNSINSEKINAIYEIADKFAADFLKWKNYKYSVDEIADIKTILANRVIKSVFSENFKDDNFDKSVKYAVSKTTDMLFGAMKSSIVPENIHLCKQKLLERARL